MRTTGFIQSSDEAACELNMLFMKHCLHGIGNWFESVHLKGWSNSGKQVLPGLTNR